MFLCHNPRCPLPTLTAQNRQKCSRCELVNYCSEACQHAHWKIHKKTTCIDYRKKTFFDMFTEHPPCELNKKLGDHSHPFPPYTKEQRVTQSAIYNAIEALPDKGVYRLSCQCKTRVAQLSRERFALSGVFSKKTVNIIFARCLKKGCNMLAEELYPLLALYKPKNIEQSIYLSFPHEESLKSFGVYFKTEPRFITGNCDAFLNNMPEGYSLTRCAILEDIDCPCPYRHEQFIVGAVNKESKYMKFDKNGEWKESK